jgi:hypothetical protein
MPGCCPKVLKARPKEICTPTVIAALFRTAEVWKQPTFLIKYWSIHTAAVSLRRKEILPHAAARMNLEDTTINEASQSQKNRQGLTALT